MLKTSVFFHCIYRISKINCSFALKMNKFLTQNERDLTTYRTKLVSFAVSSIKVSFNIVPETVPVQNATEMLEVPKNLKRS